MYALADCNNFFASCERVFRPDLEGKPVIVLSNNDGCAIARSNEAKALGIKMGDPLFKIRHIVEREGVAVFSGNMALYSDFSRRVRAVLEEFSPSVEVYSIDEAFLDLRGMEHLDLGEYARRISERCRRLTAIPVSVGIAPTKTLAKVASKLCKQYPKLQGGCYMHRPEDIEKVLKRLPIEDVWGIGRKSARKLRERHIYTAWEFTQQPETVVRSLLGVVGGRTWRELRGEACLEFEDTLDAKQSICVSRSFAHEITSLRQLVEQTAQFAASAAEKLRNQKSLASQMVVFAFTNRFKENLPQTYASIHIPFMEPTDDHRSIVAAAASAAREIYKQGYGYKKSGVVITEVVPRSAVAQSLFGDRPTLEREQRLSSAIDTINRSYGRGAVKMGIQSGEVCSLCDNQSPHYTTRWSDLPVVKLR